MVRPSAPRFLNFGDRFELPVVRAEPDRRADDACDVAVRATNADAHRRRGPRASRCRPTTASRCGFPAAAEMPGTARFQIGACRAAAAADAAEFALPVWTPATTEAFATYGAIDEGAISAAGRRRPEDVVPQFGGLEVTTSVDGAPGADRRRALPRSAIPYECAEQLASRVLAVGRAARRARRRSRRKACRRRRDDRGASKRDLSGCALQNYDGGFAFWRRGDESWPYLTHPRGARAGAREGRRASGRPPARRSSASKPYLREHRAATYPAGTTDDVRRALHRPTRCYVAQAAWATATPARGARLIARRAASTSCRMEAMRLALPVLAGDAGARRPSCTAIRRHLAQPRHETAARRTS